MTATEFLVWGALIHLIVDWRLQLGVAHFLIDTRRPLRFWGRLVSQTQAA